MSDTYSKLTSDTHNQSCVHSSSYIWSVCDYRYPIDLSGSRGRGMRGFSVVASDIMLLDKYSCLCSGVCCIYAHLLSKNNTWLYTCSYSISDYTIIQKHKHGHHKTITDRRSEISVSHHLLLYFEEILHVCIVYNNVMHVVLLFRTMSQGLTLS